MSPATSEEEQALTEEVGQARAKLGELETALAGVDEELAAISSKQSDYDLLDDACRTLDTLAERGVSRLFWGDEFGVEAADRHVEDVHARVDDYREQVARLEDKRESALDDIAQQLEVFEFLEEDLYEAQMREERRQQEWIVEREDTVLPPHKIAMPWMRGFEEDTRFHKSLLASTAVGLLLGLIIPWIDLPIPEREELIEIPERLVKLIREEPPLPPVQPVVDERPEELPDETEPEPEDETQPEPETTEVEAKPESTREKVNSKGILAFRKNFSNLSEKDPSSRLGSAARISATGEAVGRPERAMVTAQGSGSSGGINLAALSRDIGDGEGGSIEQVQLTRVASSIEGGGPDDRPLSAGAAAGRTDEEIQIVFDRYKAALYRLYNRELRKDPTLRGLMVLRLTIEPDGTVSLCQMQSSDMEAPSLAQQVVDSVSTFRFGEKDVPAITILYPIDFLPTA